MGMNKGLMRKIGLSAVSVVLVASAAVCTAVRISRAGITVSMDMIAAETTMPVGNFDFHKVQTSTNTIAKQTSIPETESSTPLAEVSEESVKPAEKSQPEESSEVSAAEFEASEPTEEEIRKYDKAHEGEAQYPVIEFTSTQGNTSYKNVQVKNSSSYNLNIKEELEGELGFTIENTDKPQVLIYHTHTSESFLDYDTGYYYESFYPRTTDKSRNVCAVGEEIAKQLNAAGIVTLHDTTIHDDPSYSGAYDRSAETVEKYLKKYPSIKVVLDIHRDGIGSDEQRSKPVFTVNGKKAAQIMVLAGYNYDGSEEFQDWEYNLRFALQIQNTAQNMYPDMVRPLYFADFMYNMNINTGSLLIEIGADSNTVEEVRYTGYLLGNVLSEVLKPDSKDSTKAE